MEKIKVLEGVEHCSWDSAQEHWDHYVQKYPDNVVGVWALSCGHFQVAVLDVAEPTVPYLGAN